MTTDERDDSDSTDAQPTTTGETSQPALVLPASLRDALADPFGPIETDAETLLASVDGPLIAVGDVVTYHFLTEARRPDVAIVDGQTKRRAVNEEVRAVVGDDGDIEVENPAGTITEAVIDAIETGLSRPEPTTVVVDGEEDLAALPAIVLAPAGSSVVYGQPDEGMVHVVVDDELRERVWSLLERFDGDTTVLETLDGQR